MEVQFLSFINILSCYYTWNQPMSWMFKKPFCAIVDKIVVYFMPKGGTIVFKVYKVSWRIKFFRNVGKSFQDFSGRVELLNPNPINPLRIRENTRQRKTKHQSHLPSAEGIRVKNKDKDQ